MRYIDISGWSRKNQYENFINYSNPVLSVCTTLNVSELVHYCKANNLSFFTSFMYIVTKSINKVDEMRMRIQNDSVVLHDCVHPSYVVLCDNGELRTCKTLFDNNFQSFYDKTQKDIIATKTRECTAYNESNDTDCFYLSCLPWVRLNSITNPYNFPDREQTSIPRVTWGKYYKNGDKYEINLDISAHHALVDGFHIASVIAETENQLLNINSLEGEK